MGIEGAHGTDQVEGYEILIQSCAKHWPFLIYLKFLKPATVWKSTWAILFANFWRIFFNGESASNVRFFDKFFHDSYT